MTTSHVVTFHKCGSNWFRRLFREAANAHGANILVSKPNRSPINQPVMTGSDRSLSLYRSAKPHELKDHRTPGDPVVLCIRDPKDVLVSQYWSWKGTHSNNSDNILAAREVLTARPIGEGLAYLVAEGQIPFLKAIAAWRAEIEAGTAIALKYEDLLADFAAAMGPVLERIALPLDPAALDALNRRYSFEALTKRESGTEKRDSHFRKGVAGDWVNYFDAALTDAFNARYGEITRALGYAPASAQDVDPEAADAPYPAV